MPALLPNRRCNSRDPLSAKTAFIKLIKAKSYDIIVDMCISPCQALTLFSAEMPLSRRWHSSTKQRRTATKQRACRCFVSRRTLQDPGFPPSVRFRSLIISRKNSKNSEKRNASYDAARWPCAPRIRGEGRRNWRNLTLREFAALRRAPPRPVRQTAPRWGCGRTLV